MVVWRADHSLAESAHARLLSRPQLLPVLVGGHAGRRHWLRGLHVGTSITSPLCCLAYHWLPGIHVGTSTTSRFFVFVLGRSVEEEKNKQASGYLFGRYI